MAYKSNVPKVLQELTAAEGRALEAIGIFVDGEITVRCPVGQYDDGRVGGALRGSYTYRVDKTEGSVSNGTNKEYGPFVEFGTGRRGAASGVKTPPGYQHGSRAGMAPQPHVIPAYEENSGRIESLAAEQYKALDGE